MQRKSSLTIERYIYGELFFTCGLCTLVLTLLLLYGNMNRHHEELLLALSLDTSLFSSLIMLLVPYAFSLALPFGFSLSVLFCVGKWSSDREIIGMDSLGFSKLNWFKPVIYIAICVSLFAAVIILHWAPQARFAFEQKKAEVVWSGFDQIVNKGEEFNFNIGNNDGMDSLKTFQSFAGEDINRLSVNIGSKDDECWKNLRILAWGERNQLLCILHAKQAFVTKNMAKGIISMELFDVDIERADNLVSGIHNHTSFISFKKWNSPLILKLPDYSSEVDSPKALTASELIQKTRSSDDQRFIESACALLSKNTMLAFSPLILSFVLIPMGVSQIRKESSSNLVMGLLLCIAFYSCGVMLSESIGGAGWGWLINGFIFLSFGILSSIRLLTGSMMSQ